MKTMICGVMAAVLTGVAGLALAQESGAKAAVGTAEIAVVVPDVSLADLKQAMENKSVTLLDCNGSKTYASGHIPGALDFDGVKADLATKLPKDKAALVVAYCGGPKCMAYKAGAEAATKLGYTNVKHFSGGLSGWKEAGATFETAALCPACGQIKGADVCCKAGSPKCGTCGMAKGSPGCCAVPKAK